MSNRKDEPAILPDRTERVCEQCGEPFLDQGDDSAWCLDCRLVASGAQADNPADLVTRMSPGYRDRRLAAGFAMAGMH
jgi:hypothetical protein